MRIIGLDCGTESIKVVELDSAFGRYDIHDYHEVPVSSEDQAEGIREVLRKLSKVPDQIITPLIAEHTTFRNLQIPTRDKKAIQAAVGYELEDELPFSSEDLIYDYAVLSQGKQGSFLHVAVSVNARVSEALLPFQAAHCEPDFLTPESWGYRVLLDRILGGQAPESPTLLIQIGKTRTVFYLHWKNTPTLIRGIHWGSQNLDIALSKHFNLELSQAANLKLERGILLNEAQQKQASPEEQEISFCLEKELDHLLSEIRQVGLLTKTLTRHHFHLVYLAGGGSLLAGFSAWLEARLQTPVKPLAALSSISNSGVAYSEETDARFALAAALALSLTGPEKNLCLNFRKASFQKEGRKRELNLKALKRPFIYAGTVAASLILSLLIQSSVYRSRLTKTNLLLEKNVRSFFGQLSNSAIKTYMANTTELRSSINKELSKQREKDKLLSPSTSSPLAFLQALSKALPREISLDLLKFSVADDLSTPISLTFILSNQLQADQLADRLKEVLNQPEKGALERFENDERKWKITFSGTPKEEIYAKSF